MDNDSPDTYFTNLVMRLADTPVSTRYFGKVCVKHPKLGGERLKSTYACVTCSRERVRTREKANPEKSKSRQKVWRRANPGANNATGARRRAAKLQATPAWANPFFIGEAYDLAQLRQKMLGGRWHVDHVVPLVSDIVCGLHVEFNLQVIPGSENELKGNRHWPDMP